MTEIHAVYVGGNVESEIIVGAQKHKTVRSDGPCPSAVWAVHTRAHTDTTRGYSVSYTHLTLPTILLV